MRSSLRVCRLQLLLSGMLLTTSCDEEVSCVPAPSGLAAGPALVAQLAEADSRGGEAAAVSIYMQYAAGEPWTHYRYRLTAPGGVTSGLLAESADSVVLLPADGREARLVACMPAAALCQDDALGPVLRIDDWDCQDQVLARQDLLVARVDGLDAGQAATELSFRHVLSRVSFDVSLRQGSSLSLDGLDVSLTGANYPMTYDVLRDVMQCDATPLPAPVRLQVSADGRRAIALLPPHAGATGRKVSFRLRSGQCFTWAMPDDLRFEPGCDLTWRVVLDDRSTVDYPDDGILTIVIPEDADPMRCNVLDDYSIYELQHVDKLRIIGPLNAFDFEALLPWINRIKYNSYLDLSRARIVASAVSAKHDTWEDGLTSWIFYNGMIQEIVLPATVTRIETMSFMGNKDLEVITLPPGLKALEKSTFANCHSLREVHFGEELDSIGESVFTVCGFQELQFPPKLRYIGSNAFRDCKQLKALHLASPVVEIGPRAFQRCTSLSWIELPATLAKIGDYAFYDCGKVGVVVVHAESPPLITNLSIGADIRHYSDLYVPDASVKSYRESAFWSSFYTVNPITQLLTP